MMQASYKSNRIQKRCLEVMERMHWGITRISPPDLVEHHKGIQPYLSIEFLRAVISIFIALKWSLLQSHYISSIFLLSTLKFIILLHWPRKTSGQHIMSGLRSVYYPL